tara:strand:+ start:420 stop:803 length:384 start_codon:yes stop_codon:yes gene_type:complete
MRFAIGSVPQLEEFMSGINMGALAQGATDLRSREKAVGIGLQGQVGGAGLRALGQAKSGGILGDAAAAAGRSQMMGSIFGTLGAVGGAAIGKFGKPSMPTTSGFTDVPNTGGGFYYAPDGSIQVNPV